jgi:PrtD family type I secretion system ABC transporter
METSPLRGALTACCGALAALLGFSLGINLLLLTAPLYMMLVFDHVLTSRSTDTLVVLTLIAVFALAFYGLLDILRAQILVRLGAWLDHRLGARVMSGVMDLALRTPAGTTGHGVRDLAALRGFVTSPAAVSLMDAPWAALFALALFALHPLLGLTSLVAAALLLAIALVNEWSTRAPLRTANSLAIEASRWADAATRNAEAVAGMGMMDAVLQEWQHRQDALAGAQLVAGDRGAVAIGISKFTRLLIQVAILAIGAGLVLRQEIGPGVMVAASLLLARVLAPIEGSIATWRVVVHARLAHGRLRELLALAPQRAAGMPLDAPAGALSLDGVSFVPPGSREPVLRNVAFQLEPGEMLGIVGPSAAGKSTLARLLVGAVPPSTGHVRLDGADIAVWQAAGGARHFGYLPQDIELFAGSVRHNIARLADASPDAIVAAATLVGMHETIMGLPQGYDTELGTAGLRLSGGQRQRVALARALFGAPRLVVLDEPSASLDAEGAAALLRAVACCKEAGATVVVVTHDPALLEQADKLLVLNKGMVVAFGLRAEVLSRLGQAMPAVRPPGAGPHRLASPGRRLA